MFMYMALPTLAILAAVGLVVFSVRYFSLRRYTAQEEAALPPEEQRRYGREKKIIIVLFFFWTTLILAHRAWITYMLMTLGGSTNSNDQAGLGLTLGLLDPLAFVPILLGSSALGGQALSGTNADFYGRYIALSLVLDALVVYLLWLTSRYAFRRAAEREEKTLPPQPPPAVN